MKHVRHEGHKKCTYYFGWQTPREMTTWDLVKDIKIILKWMLQKYDVSCKLDSVGSE